jgi:sialate O-acetylesterase
VDGDGNSDIDSWVRRSFNTGFVYINTFLTASAAGNKNYQMKRTIYLFLFLLGITLSAHSQVRLPRLVSDSMILQRDTRFNVWGWASPGEKVVIDFNQKKFSTAAGNDGKWSVTMPSMKAGGPYDMQINASNNITLKGILIGDVWVCSGQSNMELSLERVKDKYPAVIAAATNPHIRQFIVSTRAEFNTPLEDLAAGKWETANPQSILRFTAIGYFFAKELYERYKIPIGLIRSAVGGSPVEAWLSEDALQQFPHHLEKTKRFQAKGYVDSIRRSEGMASAAWYNNIWTSDKGMHEEKKWYDATYDASSWGTFQVPGFWNEQGLPRTGVVWFRKEIDVPASMTGMPARLFLGNMIDRDSVYVNGMFSGTTGYQYPPRKYDLPAGVLKPGKNIIVVRVINGAGQGGFYKDKPYRLTAGGAAIELQGPWQVKLGAASPPHPQGTTFHYQPVSLFNGMISALLPLAFKGVIWYQGESNTSPAAAAEYHTLFSAMINNWRQKWNRGNFPFIYVQLANYLRTTDQPGESNWARVREAQLKTLAVPNTAMAVAIDIGEWNDVHPLNKEDVGKRLSLAARKIAYGDKKVVYSGPVYKEMKVKDGRVILSFTNTGSGLMAKGNELKYFAIAGADKKFAWAKAKIEGNKVIVWSEQVTDPVAVRYGWADNPDGANLYNKEGLPASPFRTDNW